MNVQLQKSPRISAFEKVAKSQCSRNSFIAPAYPNTSSKMYFVCCASFYADWLVLGGRIKALAPLGCNFLVKHCGDAIHQLQTRKTIGHDRVDGARDSSGGGEVLKKWWCVLLLFDAGVTMENGKFERADRFSKQDYWMSDRA